MLALDLRSIPQTLGGHEPIMQTVKGAYFKYQHAGAAPLAGGDPSPTYILTFIFRLESFWMG